MLGSGTQKQSADLLSSRAASLLETKATIPPLPGLGNCVCSIYPSLPPSLTYLLTYFGPASALDEHFPSYLPLSESSLHSVFFTAITPHV